MPIETFAVAYTPDDKPRAWRQITSVFVNPLIDEIKALLLEAGWTLEENLKASGFLYVPGWVANYAPMKFNGTEFINDTCAGCGQFGTSGLCHISGPFTGTLASLASRVTACTNYIATPSGDALGLVVTAVAGGTAFNSPQFQTAIGVGLATQGGPYNNVAGGGYRMRSQAANGLTQYEIEITQFTGTESLSLKVRELVTGTSVTYLMHAGPPAFTLTQTVIYFMYANPYQFCMLDMVHSGDTAGPFATGGNSILITAPWNNEVGLTYNLAVIGPGMMKNSLLWTSQSSSFAINAGGFHTFNRGDIYATGMAGRLFPFSQPLFTSAGKPLRHNAWIEYAQTRDTEAAIMGKIWDGLLLSQAYGQGSKQLYDGHNWQMISTMATPTVGSLWLAYE